MTRIISKNMLRDLKADKVETLTIGSRSDLYKAAWDQGYRVGMESAQPKWISVEERLPEEDVTVLGAFLRYNGYEINITKYCVYPHKSVWFIGDMNAVGGTPTHWMPLPLPPKEG